MMASMLPVAFHPLRRKLPLFAAVALTLVVAVVAWLAGRRLEAAIVAEGIERLRRSAERVGSMTEPSIRRIRRDAERFNGIQRITEAVEYAESSPGLSEELAAEVKRSEQNVAIGVWANGKLIAVAGDPEIAALDPPRLTRLDGLAATRTPTFGPLRRIRDSVVFPTITPVIGDSTAPPMGAVVVWRRLISGQTATLFGQLIGDDAQVRLGNADGSLWSDFARVTDGPRLAVADSGFQYTNAVGREMFAGSSVVEGTPWVAVVEMPADEVLDPVNRFFLETLFIAAPIILLAVLLTWLTVGRSLRPLGEVMQAAEAVAAGDYTQRAKVGAHDEAGRLAQSFNVMAERVGSATRELESRAIALEDANEELQQSESRYHSLVDHSPDGILIHDEDRIVFANAAASRLLGTSAPQALQGRSLSDFVPPESRAPVRQLVGNLLKANGSTGLIEQSLVRDDGSRITVESTATRLKSNGHEHVQIILHDITARKQLEEQFRHAQKMEAVGRLAGGVAHDFNNLLTVIESYSDFVMSDMEPDNPHREDLAEVRRAAATAAQLTRQLLAFSRKQVLSPRVVALNDTIRGLLSVLQRLIGDHIRLETTLRPELPAIHADPAQVQQILLNLAVNARDAMPSGGVLKIETTTVTIAGGSVIASGAAIPAGTYAMLVVQDTGMGMSEEVRARIFEPFFTTKQVGHGTGLGLSTVYGIVTQSHGHIVVESAPGKGTTFKIYLPEADAAAREEPPRPALASHPAPAGCILVVEDDSAVREAMRRTLERAGHTVRLATNAAEALEHFKSSDSVALVVTDIVMPGMTGTDLARAILAERPGTPVMVMSGYSEEMSGDDWQLPPGVTFVEKPILPTEFLETVGRLLESRRR